MLSDYWSGNSALSAAAQLPDVMRMILFDPSIDIAQLFDTMLADEWSPLQANNPDHLEKARELLHNEMIQTRIVIGSSVTLGSGLSVGYVMYLLRGGALMSSMLSAMPAWRFIDPLPVLGSTGFKDFSTDQESLQSIVNMGQDKTG